MLVCAWRLCARVCVGVCVCVCVCMYVCACVCLAVCTMYYSNRIGMYDRATHNGLGKIAAVQWRSKGNPLCKNCLWN